MRDAQVLQPGARSSRDVPRERCELTHGIVLAIAWGMTQATYDVLPQDGGWLVRMAGDSVHEWHSDKGEAVRRARELGRPYDVWHVRIYERNGTLEQELTSTQAETSGR